MPVNRPEKLAAGRVLPDVAGQTELSNSFLGDLAQICLGSTAKIASITTAI